MPKEEKAPHPRSRKADQLLKKNAQKLRKGENKKMRDKKLTVLHKHCLWYHDYVTNMEQQLKIEKPNYKNALQVKKRFTEDEMHTMIEAFVKYREEKFQEKKEKKRGKLGTILQLAAMEREEYEKGAGLKAPDLLIKENYTKFLRWDREANTLVGIKVKCFKSLNELPSVWNNVDQEAQAQATTTTKTTAEMSDK